jgi:hypothetical protein
MQFEFIAFACITTMTFLKNDLFQTICIFCIDVVMWKKARYDLAKVKKFFAKGATVCFVILIVILI